ncbi:MAG TPA: glycosyltransferase family A protein [Pyrinomonadaceae bacterium]|nr:glycosyltransferase family A protein [Pyrinomonadaceae bacterium]
MTISTDTTENFGSSKNAPAVTVVIPAYNSAHYIKDTLDSLKDQNFTDFEVIVVNDGSDDREELEHILKSHPLPVTYISQENKGVSAARNAAIRIARGEFYAQLDADDQWTPDYLQVQLGILKQNPDVTLVYPNATIIGEGVTDGLDSMKVTPSEGEVNFSSLVQQKCVVMTCVTARMSAIREAGMFDESIRSCEDFDLWLRIVKKGGRIVYHRDRLVLYRRHEGSLSSDRVWMTRNLLRVFEKAATTFELTPAERQVLNEQVDDQRAMLNLFEGKHALSAGNTSAALTSFQQANEHRHQPKLSAVIFLLRYVPFLVRWVYMARERLLAKQPYHQLTGIDKPRTPSSSELAPEPNSKAFTESTDAT